MATTAAVALTACQGGDNSGSNDTVMIDKPDFKPTDRQYTIDVLEAFGRVASPVVSPDKSKILYTVSYESVEQNRSNADLYVMNVDGSDKKRLTSTPESENGAVWIDGGNKIAFMAAKEGKQQLWVMNADGSGRKVVSDVENGIGGFLFSPDEKHVIMIGSVKYVRTAQDVYPDLPKATGRVIDDLVYKHWDEWVTEIPHPLLGEFDGSTVANVTDIMDGEPFEAPMKPFGGIESFAWSPDSQSLIYVSRKKTGRDYALSTNSDLYLYSLADKSTRNLTEGMMGYDTNPRFSPDGKQVAWLSMERDGYESDKNRIFVMDLASGEKTDLTTDWDFAADNIAWNPDGKSIYFLAPKGGVIPVFAVNVADKQVSVVAEGRYDYAELAPVDGNTLITMRHSMIEPNEIYSVNAGKVTKLTEVNAELLAEVDMPSVDSVLVPTTDGKLMTTWVVYPPKFDQNKKYPAILYCQGGPQQAVSQMWSFRWNMALMAAQGYIVICPNRRGLPGFGTEWNQQISGDYPGQNMRDYLAAVDFMKEKPFVDAEHIGAVGASYGGFSVYWLAGNHDGRFAALIAHAGIFNMEAQYLETEEMWFANWDMGGGPVNAPVDATTEPDYGAFWAKDNAIAQRTFAMSPHRFVDKWTAPILITHGEFDYRILSSQGEMAFNAARLRNVPAEMLIFPDENHWILKPQNSVMWQRVFFRWLDRWLKPDSDAAKQAAAEGKPSAAPATEA